MKKENIHQGFRHSGEIIPHTVWFYSRFTLSIRDVEETLAYRGTKLATRPSAIGVTISDKTIPRKSDQNRARPVMSGI